MGWVLAARQPNVKGMVDGFIMKPDNFTGELIGVAVFQDQATYRVNAEDPGQHQWFLKLRELLEEEPACGRTESTSWAASAKLHRG